VYQQREAVLGKLLLTRQLLLLQLTLVLPSYLLRYWVQQCPSLLVVVVVVLLLVDLLVEVVWASWLLCDRALAIDQVVSCCCRTSWPQH
jgi:hypothetical protein